MNNYEETTQEKESGGLALEDSEKRYRRLFESAKDGILILDATTGTVVDVNPFLLQLLGYSYDAICGQYIWELGAFKNIAAAKDAFKRLQDNEYIRYDDLPLETHDGKAISVEFVSNVYQVDHHNVIQCNIRDITERKRAERALIESEAKTRNILDNIGIGVALINPEMEVLELNRRMREWFPGVDPGQRCLCYHAFNDPPHETACEICPTQETLQDGLVHEGTVQKQMGGSNRTYRIVSSPLLNARGGVTAAIELVEDITEKLFLESQLRQALKMEAVGQLAGGVAHDFNNMLSVILGYAELALGSTDLPLPLRANLEEIRTAALHSADITRQLLAFARKQTIVPTVLDLNETIEGILKMFRRLIGENIDLCWLPEAGLWPIMMDPVQINQILANLCVNARDAITDVGKLTIETANASLDEIYCAYHPGFEAGEYVMLSVSDDGCGMDKDILDQVFEPFFTRKLVGQGTGLGLATVYGIVKQNNGFVNVYSEPGKGTTFKIYLRPYTGNAVDLQREQPEKVSLGHGETVLVVEDEHAIGTMIKKMLEKLGYQVLVANAPGEALGLAEQRSGEIHLLITDVVMPDMNGRDLAELIQSRYPGVKCLFMSGYTASVIATSLEKSVKFIQKPFSTKDLAVKVRAALTEK